MHSAAMVMRPPAMGQRPRSRATSRSDRRQNQALGFAARVMRLPGATSLEDLQHLCLHWKILDGVRPVSRLQDARGCDEFFCQPGHWTCRKMIGNGVRRAVGLLKHRSSRTARDHVRGRCMAANSAAFARMRGTSPSAKRRPKRNVTPSVHRSRRIASRKVGFWCWVFRVISTGTSGICQPSGMRPLLLRPRRERPCHGTATQQRDQLAPI